MRVTNNDNVFMNFLKLCSRQFIQTLSEIVFLFYKRHRVGT